MVLLSEYLLILSAYIPAESVKYPLLALISPLALMLFEAVILVDSNFSIYPIFQFFVELPRLNVESAFGIKLEVRSAEMVKESESASPICMLPPIVTSPVNLEAPATSTLPNDPVEVTDPDISPLAVILLN